MYTCITAPQSPAVAPGREFPSFLIPLGQVNGQDTRACVAVENHTAKEGPVFFMRQGKYGGKKKVELLEEKG